MKRTSILFSCILILASWCVQTIALSQAAPASLDGDGKFKLKAKLVGHESQVFRNDFNSSGDLIATADETTTRIWTTTGQLLFTLDGKAPFFTPDGRSIVTIKRKNATVWDAVTGKLKFTLAGHERDITSMTFSRDGSKLATGSEDGTVKIWDATTGQTSTTLKVWRVKKIPRYRIISRALDIPVWVFARFSPDGQTVLTTTYWEQSPAKLWDVKTGLLRVEMAGPTREVLYEKKTDGVDGASFSPDGKFIVTKSSDSIRLWETATGRLITEFTKLFPITEFSPDSRWLGFIRDGNNVGLLNLETMKLQPMAEVETGYLNQHGFSPDSRTYVMASGYKKYHATLIDVATGRVRATIPLVSKWGFDIVSEYQKDVDLLSFHPNSRFLIGASHNSVRMWDVSTGAPVWETLEGRDPAEFNRDGQLLATVGRDKKTVLLWEANNLVSTMVQ
jgi:WD40 repeat protein